MADGSGERRHVSGLVWMRAIRDSDALGSPTSRVVAWAIGLRMDADGVCWPSLPTIARESRVHRSTVQRHITVLVAEGWLRREKGGGHRSTRYIAMIPPAELEAHASRGSRVLPLTTQGATPDYAHDDRRGSTRAPRSSQEVPMEGSAPHEPDGSAPTAAEQELESWVDLCRREHRDVAVRRYTAEGLCEECSGARALGVVVGAA
jgi:hypothetical protein